MPYFTTKAQVSGTPSASALPAHLLHDLAAIAARADRQRRERDRAVEHHLKGLAARVEELQREPDVERGGAAATS